MNPSFVSIMISDGAPDNKGHAGAERDNLIYQRMIVGTALVNAGNEMGRPHRSDIKRAKQRRTGINNIKSTKIRMGDIENLRKS